jgi:hypothetical protein
VVDRVGDRWQEVPEGGGVGEVEEEGGDAEDEEDALYLD